MGDIWLFLLLQTSFYPLCQSNSERNAEETLMVHFLKQWLNVLIAFLLPECSFCTHPLMLSFF